MICLILVCVQLYGDKGKTDVIKLDDKKNNFERGYECNSLFCFCFIVVEC